MLSQDPAKGLEDDTLLRSSDRSVVGRNSTWPTAAWAPQHRNNTREARLWLWVRMSSDGPQHRSHCGGSGDSSPASVGAGTPHAAHYMGLT